MLESREAAGFKSRARQELIARLKHHLHLKNHIEQASLNIPEVWIDYLFVSLKYHLSHMLL